MTELMRPIDRECEIARAMTNSDATNEQIIAEYSAVSLADWNDKCKRLDKVLSDSNLGLDDGWSAICVHFWNEAVCDTPEVDEATLFVAYMEWLYTQKSLMQLHSQLHM